MASTPNTPCEPSKVQISYWLKRNRYGGSCFVCDAAVAKGDGYIQKSGSEWQTVCYDCVRAHGKATPIFDKEGRPMHAPSLNRAHYGGDIFNCNKCKMDIVLVKSDKTGKWYFCEIQTGRTDVRYACLHAPHSPESCEAHLDRMEEINRAWREMDARNERDKRLMVLREEAMEAWEKAPTPEEARAILAEYQATVKSIHDEATN